MGYYIDTTQCGGTTLPYYTCSSCPDPEYGRVRSVFLVKRTYYDTLIASIATPSIWTTAVSAGDVIVYPFTQGSYDGGTVAELPGFGDAITMNGNRTHTLEMKDINFVANCDHWNALQDSREYVVGFRTATRLLIPSSSSAVCTITPKNPVADDATSVVTMNVTFKWIDTNIPCDYSVAANTFDRCIVRS